MSPVPERVLEERPKAHYNRADSSEEERELAFRTVIRELAFSEIDSSLASICADGKLGEKIFRSEVKVHHRALINAHISMIEGIQNALERFAERIPTNRHNIKEALQAFVTSIDPFDEVALQRGQQSICTAVDIHQTDGGVIYNHDDLAIAHQRGFEEGYERALQTLKEQQIAEIADTIDLS